MTEREYMARVIIDDLRQRARALRALQKPARWRARADALDEMIAILAASFIEPN